MDLIRDEPRWAFTGFPGFGPRPLRVWRAPTGVLAAVVTETLDQHRDSTAGTDLIEAYELVLSQLQADHPGEVIDLIICERYPGLDFDTFHRVTFGPDRTETTSGLVTNHVIDHLGADGMYRRSTGPVDGPRPDPCRMPGDLHRMPGS